MMKINKLIVTFILTLIASQAMAQENSSRVVCDNGSDLTRTTNNLNEQIMSWDGYTVSPPSISYAENRNWYTICVTVSKTK